MRTSVLIPLHASGAAGCRWSAATSQRLAPHAHLVVSDATGLDEALPRLRQRFAHLADVEWLGPRPLPPGWVAHCNDLAERTPSELLMRMPHDDEVDATWVTSGERALDTDPTAVLALGSLRSLERDEHGVDDRSIPSGNVLDPHPPFLERDPETRVREALRICLHGRRGLLGTAFRGVFRRESALPLPEVPNGAWADMLWAVSVLATGRFATTEAIYWKRWYAGNTHRERADPRTERSFRAELLPAALTPLPAEVRSRVLSSAWAEDAAWYEARTDQLETLAQARERLRSRRDTVAVLRERLRSVQPDDDVS